MQGMQAQYNLSLVNFLEAIERAGRLNVAA
jgi:hypothetical protein